MLLNLPFLILEESSLMTNKQITFQIWNLDTNEIEDVVMDEDAYYSMVEFEKKYKLEQEEKMKRLYEEEWYELRYLSDD